MRFLFVLLSHECEAPGMCNKEMNKNRFVIENHMFFSYIFYMKPILLYCIDAKRLLLNFSWSKYYIQKKAAREKAGEKTKQNQTKPKTEYKIKQMTVKMLKCCRRVANV